MIGEPQAWRSTPGEGADVRQAASAAAETDPRSRLLAGLPVREQRLDLAGISTTVLVGGEGAPVVLLHGPGEFGGNWLRVIPELTRSRRVIAPDLPAHGSSGTGDGVLDEDRVVAWLGALIERTCASPPVLVGHVLGGAIAARFASRHAEQVGHLVLVDSLGLAPFRPAPAFALTMAHFLVRPGETTYGRFMRQCSYDLDALREEMGDRWEPFVSYNLRLARSPGAKMAGRLLRTVGLPPIPPGDLARIAAPTALIWGRHDRANRLRVAEAASARYGWPLHVIENAADDPPRDQPRAFLEALERALARGTSDDRRHPASPFRARRAAEPPVPPGSGSPPSPVLPVPEQP